MPWKTQNDVPVHCESVLSVSQGAVNTKVNEHGNKRKKKHRHPPPHLHRLSQVGYGNTWLMGHYLPITDNYWWFIHRALGLGLLASCAAGQPGA